MTFTSNESQGQTVTPGSTHVFGAQGNFGGGTLALEWSYAKVTWSPVTDSNGAISLTDDGGCTFDSPGGYLRVTLSGATAPNIVAYITEK